MPRAGIDVIVPVCGAPEALARCLASLEQHADAGLDRILLVVDGPQTQAVELVIAAAAARRSPPALTVLYQPERAGYPAAVQRGIEEGEASGRDVVLLNSDTEVADGWLDRLAACARREPRAGTVTPFSNNATICSYPRFCERNSLPEGLSTAELDRRFARANAGRALDIPTAVGFCMYIRRDCLDEVGCFDEAAFGRGYGEEVDFCMRAARRGFRHLLCADTFVYHEGEVSFGDGSGTRESAQRVIDERYPEFPRQVRDFVERDPPRPLREAVSA